MMAENTSNHFLNRLFKATLLLQNSMLAPKNSQKDANRKSLKNTKKKMELMNINKL
jgi:hypothetical protein